MSATTQFTDPAAAEAWDAWFRWREAGGLRDRTIDSTWSRVADAIAAVEGARASLWAHRFVDAFSHWRLLPDERLLQFAGTGVPVSGPAPLTASLNLAAFVIAPGSRTSRIDADRLADVAALAVRLLDDALRVWPGTGVDPAQLQIGVLGLADALRALNSPYDSAQSRLLAQEFAIALAHGTLRGSIELACERGAIKFDTGELALRMRARGTPATMIEDASRWGVRHTRLTAIQSQPRLALLANQVSDALDPMLRASASADNRSSASARSGHVADLPSVLAQVAMRIAMQPWIDAQIDYPFVAVAEPRREDLDDAVRLASEHGLPPPRWRHGELATPFISAPGRP